MRKIVVSGVILLIPFAVFGNEVTITPHPGIGQDTYVYSDYPDRNYGDEQHMLVYMNSRLSFLRFTQLEEYTGYEITSAELEITITYSSGGITYFNRVLGPWEEDILVWYNQPPHSYDEYITYNFPDVYYYYQTIRIDVTWMVQRWLNEEWENFGWCLSSQYGVYSAMFTSNASYYRDRPSLTLEGPGLPPLEVQPTSLGKLKAIFAH